ncbi:Leptomycin B resistance protein pmd1-like protein 4 [Colletotrichum truncatum]|uniref:Leptomycin B resistance protein pmd1-like protein 4 n=1 Tax=Colletotrichum truncatum TaxID=5467 RepID=A0ACC3Z997_COLTU|nr:Leptomycin B resistance protein pmd1-like protein 4 [Colletotrichum truncatum]KAF6793572.1 Leptomycin B resistance protein pmd1-like protein 4 [Colletotrichum truncatum]
MAVDQDVRPAAAEHAVNDTSNVTEQEQTPVAAGANTFAQRFETFFSYFRLLFYAEPTWIDVLLFVVGSITAAAAGVPFPLMGILFGQLIDDMNGASCSSAVGDADTFQAAVNDKVLTLVYISIGSFVLIYCYTTSWSMLSQRLAQRFREKYFQSLLRQDAGFFENRQAGEVSSRLNSDIQTIQTGASEKVGIFIATISFFITAYVIGFIKYAKLAGMLVSLIPAFLLMSIICGGFVQKWTGTMSDGIAKASSIASEALSHVAVVQAFGAGPRLEAKFSSHMMHAQKEGIKKAIAAATQAGFLYFLAYSANALAYWQGSKAISETVAGRGNGTSVGDIYTVVFLIVDACIMLGTIAPLLPLFGSASAAFVKLRKDIEFRSDIDSVTEDGEKLPATIEGSVELRGVTFAYPSRPDQNVLKKVSLVCPGGKYTAIVGLSGSGKSTIAGLATRLYDPKEGTVLLDGRDIRNLNVRNVRSYISLVQQEPSLLDRSVLENIALGLVNSPKEEHQGLKAALHGPQLAQLADDVQRGADLDTAAQAYGPEVVEIAKLVQHAADLADATSFIYRLRHGFGTPVGTGGKLVSGGQTQRVALARALIRDPKILILDEATAALDSASEHRIQTAVESVSKGRTLISIAHRLSTIKNADNIIVMNAGDIVEQGTHTDLIARNGAYANLVRLQNIHTTEEDVAPSRASTAVESLDNIEIEKGGVDPTDLAKAITEAEGKETKKDPKKTAAEELLASGLDSNKSAWQVTKKLGGMIRPHSLWLVLAMVAAFIVGCTYSASGTIFGYAIGSASPCNSPSYISSKGSFYAGLFFMLACVELVANLASWSAFGFLAEKLLYRIRVLSFRSLFQQELEWHQSENRNPTTLLSVITKDAAAIGGFSGSIMGTIFAVVVNLLVAIIYSHILAWRIAIVCLVILPILLGSGIMQIRVLSRFEEKHAGAYAQAVGITVESVNSIKTVATLSLEHEVLGQYKRALKGPKKEVISASAIANIWLAIANSTGNIIYAFAYWWGSKQIAEGRYTQTQFLIILVAMLVGAQLWGQMFSLAPEVTRARMAASRIFSLLDLDNSEATPSSKDTDASCKGKEKDVEALAESKPRPSAGRGGVSISFKNVSFAYPARPEVQILDNMSFTIQPGQFCGLVGPSGAGKSTVMAIVQRMYTPSTGTVEIDGMDISKFSGTDFRDDIAVVPQDSALFDGSVKFNVGLGARPGQDASDQEIEEACRLANIHETIAALPQGYDTECGPNGSQLSGGQRQRIAIARALVRKPRLLLLDESTSALDAESEKALQEGLERAARGITVIAIAHRLHTVRKADVIFVVEAGAVAAKGRHEELMEKSESYRLNAMQQMLGH